MPVLGNVGTVYGNNKNPRESYIRLLFIAVDMNNIENVKEYLKSIQVLKIKEVINAVSGPTEYTLLHQACGKGYLDIVTALVEAGANINAVDINNISPVVYAATNGKSDIVEYLSTLDIDPNILRTDYDGESALMYTAWKCSSKAAIALIEKGADVNAKRKKDLHSPIQYAIYNSDLSEAIKIIRALLDAGADVNIQYTDRDTPLVKACHNGRLDIVKLLVDAGADTNYIDSIHITPVFNAAYDGFSDIVVFLCQFNPNVRIARIGIGEGETALMFAGWRCNINAVKALLDIGADPNAVKKADGFTPLMYSIHNKHGRGEADKIIDLLIQNGANIDEHFKREYFYTYDTQYTPSSNSKSRKSRKSRKSKSRKHR